MFLGELVLRQEILVTGQVEELCQFRRDRWFKRLQLALLVRRGKQVLRVVILGSFLRL